MCRQQSPLIQRGRRLRAGARTAFPDAVVNPDRAAKALPVDVAQVAALSQSNKP